MTSSDTTQECFLFGEWLQHRILVELGKKVGTLSATLKVTPQTVYNWIKGKCDPTLNPNQTTYLCEFLEVDLAELDNAFMGLVEKPPAPEPEEVEPDATELEGVELETKNEPSEDDSLIQVPTAEEDDATAEE